MRTPANSPILVPHAMCANDKCGKPLRCEIEQTNGKITNVVYYCDSCEYGFAGFTYLNGMPVKYKAPSK